jgi:hypothetical protein
MRCTLKDIAIDAWVASTALRIVLTRVNVQGRKSLDPLAVVVVMGAITMMHGNRWDYFFLHSFYIRRQEKIQ